MGNDSSIKNILQSSLDQIRSIVDANTVLGNPVNTPSGTVIIPISKLSIGFASGGLELPREASLGNQNFGGGGGTGVTLIPLGILAIYSDGKVDMIPMTPPGEKISNPVGQLAELLDNAPSIISRIKDALAGVLPEKKDGEDDLTDEEIEAAEDEYSEKLNLEDAIPLTEKERNKILKIEEKAAKRAGKL